MSLDLLSPDEFEHKSALVDGRKPVVTIRERTGPESDDEEVTESEDTRKKTSISGSKGCSVDDNDRWKIDGPLDEITICEIRKRFYLDSTTCVANRVGIPVRCRNLIANSNQQSAREILERSLSERPPNDNEEYGVQLSLLIDLTFCKRNHKSRALHKTNSWLSKVAFEKAQTREKTRNTMRIKSELRSPITLTETPNTKLTRRLTSPYKHGEICHEEEVQRTGRTVPGELPRSEIRSEAGEPPSGFIRVRVQSFLPYVPSKYRSYSVEELIEDILSRNLMGREWKKAGHIYMYGHPGAPGMIKIGVTTTSTEERLKRWEAQCGRKIELLYSTQYDLEEAAIPHCYRAEALIHTDLALHRKRIPICPGCGRCHKEWFEADAEYVKATIRKWADWIRQKPYEEVGLDYPRLRTDKPTGTIWRLKSIHELNVTGIYPLLRTNRELAVVAPGQASVEILLRRNPRLAKRA